MKNSHCYWIFAVNGKLGCWGYIIPFTLLFRIEKNTYRKGNCFNGIGSVLWKSKQKINGTHTHQPPKHSRVGSTNLQQNFLTLLVRCHSNTNTNTVHSNYCLRASCDRLVTLSLATANCQKDVEEVALLVTSWWNTT